MFALANVVAPVDVPSKAIPLAANVFVAVKVCAVPSKSAVPVAGIVRAFDPLFTPVPPYVAPTIVPFQVPAVIVPTVAMSVPTSFDAAILPASIEFVTVKAGRITVPVKVGEANGANAVDEYALVPKAPPAAEVSALNVVSVELLKAVIFAAVPVTLPATGFEKVTVPLYVRFPLSKPNTPPVVPTCKDVPHALPVDTATPDAGYT